MYETLPPTHWENSPLSPETFADFREIQISENVPWIRQGAWNALILLLN